MKLETDIMGRKCMIIEIVLVPMAECRFSRPGELFKASKALDS